MAQTGPIFIHSLFRCASTFFFQKFRALGAKFTCYQEPFNESLEALNRPSRQVRLLASPDGSLLRHPRLDKPYFFEFWLRRQQLQGLYRRTFAYREYFAGSTLPAAQQRWIAALLTHAQGCAVLQFCRSTGRAAALRTTFGGVHLHLWREPRAQWWSYKVGDYFDSVSRRIYDAPGLPAALAQLRHQMLDPRASTAVLSARQNYALYYGLWLHSWLALSELADASISVDRIAFSEADNGACMTQLAALLGEALDLTDISTPGMAFAPDELPFYESVEQRVGELFVAAGQASAARIACAEGAAADVRLAHARRPHDARAERNLRQAALAMMDRTQRERWAPRQSRHATEGAAKWPLLTKLRRFWPVPSGHGGVGAPGEPHSGAPLLAPVRTETARNGYHRG
ncbi:MAG TPA: hypothetical protein VHY19_14545 [Steroidobacteraceae bacterium]|nr:hypothetical protein [Steroidobacteraceae bacterium]